MCGILAYIMYRGGSGACQQCGCCCKTTGKSNNIESKRTEILALGRKLRHRGPDWDGNFSDINSKMSLLMVHQRLSIIDPFGGSQPLIHQLPNGHKIVLSVNGEIFNYKDLKSETADFDYTTSSDCEPILALYMKYRDNIQLLLEKLDGQFSFVLYDSELCRIIAARDPIGITSLYYAKNVRDSTLIIASEMKAIPDEFHSVEQFPPGCYLELNETFASFEIHDYYSNSLEGAWKKRFLDGVGPFISAEKSMNEEVVFANLREILIDSVKKRLMTDVPFGMLLSGGLDSSLVCSIACKLIKEHNVKNEWDQKIHTFAVGLEGSPDLEKAQEVADFLGTYHRSFKFSIKEGLDAIHDVIYFLETYDTTTIRASTPMYLLSRCIKSTGVKMVLSGEGSDEILGGYLYFLKAPNDLEFNKECHRRVSALNKFDCLRADKSTMAWGVEGRFPFLDKSFISYAIDLDPQLKRKQNIEKYALRKAFDINENGTPVYLPDSILWRQKEQFSDGVGYNWIGSLIEVATQNYTDQELEVAKHKYLINPPQTKEALRYREIFESLFPRRENTADYWIPRTDWDGVGSDPSGRAQSVHLQAKSFN